MGEARASLQLGKYRLIIELAQGGMGCVYLAVAEGPAGFSKLTVIKELKKSLLEEPGFLEMFLDEAKLSARLSHPNVVQTNEVSVDGNGAWLSMEYLDGQSLVRVRARMARLGRFPLPVHLRIIAEACHGLHYAHELRDFDGTPLHVVHRDVSPHNVFVTYDGQVKIVDFGIAKAMSSSHETGSGVMKGKLPYMAPEQILGTGADRRIDVFSVGVMIWEAVANRRFWDKIRPETIMGRLMSGQLPRLVEAVPDAPPRLLALVDRATAPHPNDRYPTMEALRSDLELCIAELGGADPSALRDFGRAMTDAFTEERARVNEAIQAQLRLLRDPAPSSSLTLLAISQSGGTGEYGAALRQSGGSSVPPMHVSGAHGGTAVLPTIAVPMDGSGGSGTGKTGGLALAHSHHPPGMQPSSRVAMTAVVSFIAVAVISMGLYVGFGRPSSQPKAPPTVVETSSPPPAITTPTAVLTVVSATPAPIEPPRTAPDAMASSTPSGPKVVGPRGTNVGGQGRRPGTGETKKPPTNDDPDLGY